MGYVILKSTQILPGQSVLRAGEVFDDADPFVKANPGLFGPIEARSIEQATAAPGEKRATKRAAKKATAKK